MTTTKTNHKRRERDKQRFLASELLASLRGAHPYGQVYNVASEINDEAIVQGSFRILGGHRVSEWAVSDYAALVVSSFYSTSIAEPTGYNLVMTEANFEAVSGRLKVSGLWARALLACATSTRLG